MPLPYNLNFTPLDPLTAQELNDMVSNIEAVQDFSAFDDDSFPISLIPDGAITPDKLSGGVAMGAINTNASSRVITGLGFRPVMVEFFLERTTASLANGSQGISIGTTDHRSSSWSINISGDASTLHSNSYSVLEVSATTGTALVEGYVSAIGEDGFTVSFATTGDYNFTWIARG